MNPSFYRPSEGIHPFVATTSSVPRMAFLSPILLTPHRPFLGSTSPAFYANPHRLTQKSAVAASTRRSRLVCISSPVPTQTQAEQLVDELLVKVKGTDVGLAASSAERQEIEAIVRQLMEIGKSQEPMKDPRLFSKYSVAYTSTGDKSPPAGGLFRSRVGRLLFVTRGLFQHVFKPDTVVNLVCFRVLGILKGCVGLRGKLVPIEDEKLGPNGIKVTFEKPRLCLGSFVFQFGPRSTVRLATTYVDDRVRLAIGGRGSLFVFAKDAAAESAMADEWNPMFQAQTWPAILLPLAVLTFLGLTFLAPWPVRIAGIVIALIAGFVLKRGGIAHNAPGALED